MVSRIDEKKNCQELYGFLQENRNVTLTKNRNWMFEANIFYQAPIGNKNFTSNIHVVESYNDNTLRILNEDDISADEYHLDLSVNWQNFKFNKQENSLSVTGSSPKVGGNYSIHISNPNPSTL